MPHYCGTPQRTKKCWKNADCKNIMASKNYYSSSSNCSVGASDIAGRGTFATRHIGAGVELFRETAFLVSRGGNGPRAVRKRDSIIAGAPSRCQHAKISVDASPKQMCASLSAISIQHKHCPPSVRLAPADTGGTLSGSEDTYWFAKAYAACSSVTRAAVQELDTFGGDESHAVFEVVRAESVVLRQFDPDLRLLPTDELERAIQRYWANTFGLEGALHNRGSRFNHSCSPNCTSVLLDGASYERSFVTLKPVQAGEELTLSYIPSEMEAMGTTVRRRHLWLSRGFLCQCERCLQPQDDLRQVACPECAISLPPRTRRRGWAWNPTRARRVSGGEEVMLLPPCVSAWSSTRARRVSDGEEGAPPQPRWSVWSSKCARRASSGEDILPPPRVSAWRAKCVRRVYDREEGAPPPPRVSAWSSTHARRVVDGKDGAPLSPRGPARSSKRALRVSGGEEETLPPPQPPQPPPSTVSSSLPPPSLLLPLAEPEEAEFADWWNLSGMWVCRQCGWCSDRLGRLHHKEAVLSAEVFSRVMVAAVVVAPPPPPAPPLASTAARSGKKLGEVDDLGGPRPRHASESEEKADQVYRVEGAVETLKVEEAKKEEEAEAQGISKVEGAEKEVEAVEAAVARRRRRWQTRRDAVQAMLDESLALVGGRHWASFACTRMRLGQELSFRVEKGKGEEDTWEEGEEEGEGGGEEWEKEGVEEEEAEGGVKEEEKGEKEEGGGGEGRGEEVGEVEDSTLTSALPSWTPSPVSPQSRTITTPSQPTQLRGMRWALRELNSLWRWLSETLLVTNHPPAYYLFELVCDIMDVHGSEIAMAEQAGVEGRAGGSMEDLRLVQDLRFVLTSVDAWVSVYGDEQQRLRFGAAVVAKCID